MLAPAAMNRLAAERWPDVRDADELQGALLTLVTLPPQPEWQSFFDELLADRRVFTLERAGKPFWVAVERREMAADPAVVLRGWMESTGPATASALAGKLAFTREVIISQLAPLDG